jgi:PleD family two-component response regulator
LDSSISEDGTKRPTTKTQEIRDSSLNCLHGDTSHYDKGANEKRILIVDDTPFNNAILTHMLKTLHLSSNVCLNGKEALEKVMGGLGCNLILMDINMPIMDGIEVRD